jgi:hypothetical protein
MLDVAETLDLQEVHIICESFTANVCRRITWAILTDGRSFFNTVLVESQFRRAERFKWPTSLIHKITDDVRFAKAIDRPMYPAKWCITTPATQGTGGGGGGGGGYKEGNNQGGGQGNTNRGQNDQGGCNAGGGGSGGRRQQQQQQPWVDDRHPRIVGMMADYVASRGLRIRLTDILDAANKQFMDLPTISEYIANGRPFVCWAHVLGRTTANSKTGIFHATQSQTLSPRR